MTYGRAPHLHLAPVRVSAPVADPVTLAEAKLHSRVDHPTEDSFLTDRIRSATERLDAYEGILGGRALVTQTWRQDFDGFSDILRLPLRPVASVSSVTYYDANGVQQTLAATAWDLFTDAHGAFLSLKPDQVWPSTRWRRDAVSVTFVAGTPAADVPGPIREAILLMVSDRYTNREPVNVTELPKGVSALLRPYSRHRL